MTTFIILALATLGILAMLGAAFTFTWLCAMAGGRAVGWALGGAAAPDVPADEVLSPQQLDEIDALVRRSRKAARLPPLH